MAPPKYSKEVSSTSEKYTKEAKEEESPVLPPEYRQANPANPPGHPGDAFNPDCKYEEVPFTDCDPFHLMKWRQMKLIFGGSHCESYKNETERCSPDDFPPGTYN